METRNSQVSSELRPLDNSNLQERIRSLEEENRFLRERTAAAEEEHHKFVNLFVAAQRLSNSLDVREILEIVNEIIINLVGSEQFGLYFAKADREDSPLELVCEVFQQGALHEPPVIPQAKIRDSIQDGKVKIHDDQEGSPAAMIPLKMEGKVLGVLVLYSVLPQKNGFTATDSELFELLASTAARSFYAAMMHSKNGLPNNLPDLIKSCLCRDARFQ